MVLCLVIFVIAVLTIPNFFTSANMLNILIEISLVGIMAIGMTFLLLIGLFDISIGGQISLVSIVLALTMKFGIISSIILSLIAGMLVGAINGFITKKFKINTLIVTFAMLGILKGLNLIISNAGSIFIENESFCKIFNLNLLGIPIATIVFIVLAVCAELVLRYTKIGFDMYVIGGNIKVAKLSGVNIFFITMFCFLVSSFCVALSTILLTSRVRIASPVLGEGYILLVIAACVIGGVKFDGGHGNIINAFFGVLVIQLTQNIMYMTNTYGYIQSMLNGMILLIVLSVDKLTIIGRRSKLV